MKNLRGPRNSGDVKKLGYEQLDKVVLNEYKKDSQFRIEIEKIALTEIDSKKMQKAKAKSLILSSLTAVGNIQNLRRVQNN